MGLWDKLKQMLGSGEKTPEQDTEQEAPPPPVNGTPAAGAAAPAAKATRAANQGRASAQAASSSGSTAATSGGSTAKGAPPAAKKRTSDDPLEANEILGLSREELRKRALKINPYQTAWIGRVDTIPPQSDERTALIDRGLILRGLLTPGQIEEIHRVGDLWLEHHEAAKLAKIAAARSAQQALDAMKADREARKAQKKAEAAERKALRKEEIARRRAEDIVFLGPGVSHLLGDRRSHLEALEERGLPLLSTPADVARALGLPVPKLRWLCFHAEATEKPHYRYFEVPKRSGGTRLLAAPQPDLAKAQAWVLEHVLSRLPSEDPAHGFVSGRSTVTCAAAHVGRDVVINLDVKDFFPTITFHRVRGVFQKAGYSPAVATIFALLCTESPRIQATFEGRAYWVATGPRALPQGACTSPALSNQVSRKLDRRLAGMSRKHGLTYTRYADDLTFSMPAGKRAEIGMVMARVRHILQEEGFALHPDKGRVLRAGGQQKVTGIVVNDKLGLDRKHVRRLRAILHAAKKTGLDAQNRDNIPSFEAHLRGHIAYLHMVDPLRAAPLRAALDALTGRAPG